MSATKDVLDQLHELVARELSNKIRTGEATSADMANALRMLKDNDITIIPEDNDSLDELREKLHRKRSVHKPDLNVADKDLGELLN